jgi:hypothetical protein
MDRVIGFEPSTSAIAFSSCTYVSKRATKEREIYCSNPTRSTLILRLKKSNVSALVDIILNFDTSVFLLLGCPWINHAKKMGFI